MVNRYLIFNADDFGSSENINDAIIEAHTNGVLTSATLMANMPEFDHAVGLAKQYSKLGVGVHLNLFRGEPLSDPRRIGSLLNPQTGTFWENELVLLQRLVFGSVDQQQVYEELSAQVCKCISAGIRPTHLDSEKHLHMFPRIMKVVIQIAEDFGIAAIRCAREKIFYDLPAAWRRLRNRRFLALLILNPMFFNSSARLLAQSGVATADHFFGLVETGNMRLETYRHFLPYLKAGVTEVMVHPGKRRRKDNSPYDKSYGWPEELEALVDPALKALIEQEKGQLIHWGEVCRCLARRQ